jgi:hypothetical protein
MGRCEELPRGAPRGPPARPRAVCRGSRGAGLEERHAALTRRLAAKQGEKGRYVKLYAQGLVDDEELEILKMDRPQLL